MREPNRQAPGSMRAGRWRAWAWPLALAALWMVMSGAAWARLGGGQSFSGGGSSSSSSSGGDEVVGFLIELIFRLLFELCWYYPAVGIPVVIVLVLGVLWAVKQGGSVNSYEASRDWSSSVTPERRTSASLEALRRVDPNFSRPVFLDFMSLLYTRARTEAPQGLSGLTAYLSPGVIQELTQEVQSQGFQSLEQVIIGALNLTSVEVTGEWTHLKVHLETNFTVHTSSGPRGLYSVESWLLKRKTGTLSKGPDEVTRLACPSCGNPGETSSDGTCSYCGNKVNTGHFQWVVAEISVAQRIPKMELGLSSEGEEVGSELPTRVAPDLDRQRKALEARDPDFQWSEFEGRAGHVFRVLQAAWSACELDKIRPYETDSLFSTHRYWVQAYLQQGLRNALEEVTLERIEPVRFEPDAYYEAITVRLWAHMKDYTIKLDGGQVVSGSRSQPRRFSEYWTFIRRIGTTRKKHGVDTCPSCGAPLDQIGMTGICGYCDSKVTRGDFDWVLSQIEQDEAYQG